VTANKTTTAVSGNSSTIILWLNRGIEGLWLLAVVLVPIAFLDRDIIYSEAVIAYLEVPKVALLRTLVGLMTVLWLIEWGVAGGRFPFAPGFRNRATRFRSLAYLARLRGWLSGQPARWVVLAVWFFAMTTLLSTLLSASIPVSLWGEVPGQDSLSTYTVAAYLLLFAVVTTHLKTRPQLWRLLGAVVAMGVVVAGFAVLQHYGYDLLGALEDTGGGQARVTSTVGNAVFAGALMLIPISLSLMLATISLERMSAVDPGKGQWRSGVSLVMIISFWAIVMSIQFLGLIFTFSRGPWMGTALALLVFGLLTLLIAGWRTFGWASLTLGLAAVLTWSVLQSSGDGPAPGIGPWLIAPLVLAGVLTAIIAFRGSLPLVSKTQINLAFLGSLGLAGSVKARLVGVAVLGLGLTAGLALIILVVLPLAESAPAASVDEPGPSASSDFSDVTYRFESIREAVLSGQLSNRGDIWKGSLRLMRGHPWFAFDELSLPWLRPLVGYGPDLFRYTYLLVSVPPVFSFLPVEADHAHSFILHQGVEQGILGLISATGVFLAAFGVAGYLLIKRSGNYSQIHQLALIGLTATIAGRFLEQSVGLTRVSDLMLFWVILAVFAALPAVMEPQEKAQSTRDSGPVPTRTGSSRMSRVPRQPNNLDLTTVLRLVVVAWAIGGIIALTWVKAVSYPRAAIVASQGIDQFNQSNYQASLASLDRATLLAPDVPVYYGGIAAIYTAYLQNPQVPTEMVCSRALNGVPYRDCLVRNIHLNNILASEQRPFDWRARLARADSALALGLNDEAIRMYQAVVDLVPGAWPLHNRLAEAYIEIGEPELALGVLEDSLAITGDTGRSGAALQLQIQARQNMGPTGETPPGAGGN
jgi:hypothetical protein